MVQTLGAGQLRGRLALAEPISGSDLFLLFATEIDLSGTGQVPKGALADQLPYMQAAMAAFARQAGLTGAYLLNREGRAYISSPESPALSDAQRLAASALFSTGVSTVLPLRADERGLTLDFLVPLHPPQAANPAEADRTVGVLLLSIAADQRLADVLAPGDLIDEAESACLLQASADGLTEVRPGGTPRLSPLRGWAQTDLAPVAFAERAMLDGEESAYSLGVVVPGAPWIVIEETVAAAVLAPLRTHRLFGGLVAGLATIGFVAAAMAFWWRHGSENNRVLAQQYHEFAARIQTQRQLLDAINGSIQEHIAVKDPEGTYLYVNPAFAKLVGLPAESVVGLKDPALFDAETATAIQALDNEVLADGRRVERSIEIEAGDDNRFLQVSKGPFQDDTGRTIGVVSVARDITELMEAQQRREQAVMNTIRALSNTVEAVDPHLSGHSLKLERLCSRLAQRLDCPEADIATLEIAANLSQIGKLSVPSRILTKAERLTPEEQQIMQRHIEHTDHILSELDFGLPVREVVVQMHERLDGSGYPHGLAGDEISLLGRILAIADVFIARTTPRSYREAISEAETIELLAENTTRYDAGVIETLRELTRSAEAVVGDATAPEA